MITTSSPSPLNESIVFTSRGSVCARDYAECLDAMDCDQEQASAVMQVQN